MKSIFILSFLLFCSWAYAQKPFRVAFYNVENFFDTKNDSLTADDDFTPEGSYHWTYKRFEKKKTHIAKTIAALGGDDMVAVLGMCEIENENVLQSLLYYSPLKNAGYKMIHYNSPDKRGIDVAMLYHPKRFSVLHSYAIKVSFESRPEETTRDILYVKGIADNADTLNIFVCHAPSRRGGESASRFKRIDFANILKKHCDSIFSLCDSAKIIIMGDFNDFPDDVSMREVLNADIECPGAGASKLYNLMGSLQAEGSGSYKFRGEWNMLDQIIVSKNLLTSSGFRTTCDGAKIFRAAFLLEPDDKYFSDKPFRTYSGPRYLGGFSDHLPVFCDFIK